MRRTGQPTTERAHDLAGYEGTTELTYTLLYGGAYEDGTSTVTLEYLR